MRALRRPRAGEGFPFVVLIYGPQGAFWTIPEALLRTPPHLELLVYPAVSMWSAEFKEKTYDELRDIAEAQFHRGPGAHQTLQPTALVNEAYLRLSKWSGEYNDREHFLATAATVMRQLLVDRARARGALKRGGGQVQVEIEGLDLYESSCGDLLEFDELLTLLEGQDAQLARIVELRFFGGLTEQETAKTMKVSVSTVTRGFRMAKNWLKARLEEREDQ